MRARPSSLIRNTPRPTASAGSAYTSKGDYDRAIADEDKAIKLDPKYAYTYDNRAWAYIRAGKAAEGLPDAEKSLELRPNDANLRDTRGHIFEAMGQREEAIADYRRALSKKPDIQGSKHGLKRLGASP